jgi:hypothetical protein
LLALAVFIPVGAASAAASPARVKPLLCEHACGGKWGAYEHAKAWVEETSDLPTTITKCSNVGTNEAGVTQWICFGYNSAYHFEIGLDPYGYETFFERD